MPVENRYVDPLQASNVLMRANINGGSAQITPIIKTFAISTLDNNGSVYRLFTVNSQNTVFLLQLFNDAITGGTSFDLGLYETLRNGGAVVNKTLFMAAQTLATASTAAAPISGLSSLGFINYNKSIAELLSLTRDPNKEYDLALTANTIGTSGGNIAVRALVA